MIVDTARDAAELLASHLLARTSGAVAVLHVDAERRLIDVDLFDSDAARLPVRDILTRALRAGADSVIVAIGRPPGNAMPTEEERAAARRLADAAASLEIRLTDFFVFAGADCRSFRELGLL